MWPEPSKTEELLEHAARGEPGAVDELLARCREPVRKLVQFRLDRALARRVDASDIVQEVLLEASGRLAEYLRERTMPFHLWLRQIARDRIIDMHRRHRTAQRRSVDREQPIAAAAYADRSSIELAADLRDGELTPAAAAIRHELEQRFQLALQELAEEDREVLSMRHFEQLSNQEVAEALGLTQAAAGMRHLRALRRLRALLAESPSARGAE